MPCSWKWVVAFAIFCSHHPHGATLPMPCAATRSDARATSGARWHALFVNTFGSAAGCVAASAFGFRSPRQEGAVRLAVGVNFAVAACVLGAFLRRKIAA